MAALLNQQFNEHAHATSYLRILVSNLDQQLAWPTAAAYVRTDFTHKVSHKNSFLKHLLKLEKEPVDEPAPTTFLRL